MQEIFKKLFIPIGGCKHHLRYFFNVKNGATSISLYNNKRLYTTFPVVLIYSNLLITTLCIDLKKTGLDDSY